MQRLLAGREEEEAKGVPVRIMKPRRGRIERTAGYPGNLFPKRTVTVLSKIPGKVDRILVGKGDLVNNDWTSSFILQQREPHAHELKLGVSLPEQLMAWRRIVVASEVSSDLRDQSHRFTQQRGRRQAFFLRRLSTFVIRCR
ncbi:hypothetical protein ES703_67493 [subsurface metagenome]